MAKEKVKTADEEIQSVYINPLTDFGFKKIFLNRELLIAFLNDVVGTDIKEIQYLPTEGLGEYMSERTAVFDLLCTTQKHEYFIVEMQLGKQTYFRDRALFYAAHVIRKQAPRKKYWNYKLKAVYIVSILNFITFTEASAAEEVIERVCLYRETAKTLFSDRLNMIFVELPKFDRSAAELRNNTETWLFLLKNAFGLQSCPPEITGKIFKLFLEIAETKQLTSAEMETYKRSLKQNYAMRDIASCARMEGRMEGRTEGRVEGRVEGRMERSRQFAIRLLKRNEPIEDVIYLTDLSREQVQELVSQLPKS